MPNLVQTQQNLQSLPLQEVIDYSNGKDPAVVPTWLALMEMSRRKDIQSNELAAKNVPQQNLKQSLQNSLTNPNQMMNVDPTKAQPSTDLTAQANEVNLTQQPNQVDPTKLQTPQVNPAAQVAPPKPFKKGGLAALPVHMFKEHNFAPGGIIAFAGGSKEPTWTADDANNSEDIAMVPQGLPSVAESNTPNNKIMPLSQIQKQSNENLLNSSFYNIPSELQFQQPKTQQELYEQNKEADRIAGVSEDPLKETRERYKAIEAKQRSEKDDAYDRLIEQLTSFSQADPTKGFGFAAGQSAKASQLMGKTQEDLRNKQSIEMANLYSQMDKEDEARKRGNAKAILEAQKQQEDTKNKLAELQDKYITSKVSQVNANAIQSNADVQKYLSQFERDKMEALMRQAKANEISAGKPTGAVDYDRYATKPAYAAAVDAVKTLGNVGKTDAQIRAEFQKSFMLQDEWKDKGGEEAYMAEQRRIMGTSTGNPSTASGADSQGNPVVKGKDGKNYPQTIVKDGVTLHYDVQAGGYRK